MTGWTLKEISGQDLPIMTRITHEPTWFIVTALEKAEDGTWHSLTSREYCFDEVAKHTHTWGEWKVTKEATYTTTGLKTRSCTGCDAVETEEIACVTIPMPTLVSAAATAEKKITVTWNAVSGIDGYYVYRKVSGGKWTRLADLSADKASYVDSSVAAGTKYIYTVKAYCNNGSKKIYGGYDSAGKTATAVAKAASPTLVSAKATAGNTITFKWKAVKGIDGYRVYRKTAGGSYKKLATVSADEKSYVDTTAVAGVSYTYTVRAYNTVNGKKVLSFYNKTGKTVIAK